MHLFLPDPLEHLLLKQKVMLLGLDSDITQWQEYFSSVGITQGVAKG